MNSKFDRSSVNEILDRLKREYPEAGCALHYDTKLHLVIAVVLSAQTTDISVNKVTPALFAKYPNAEVLASADQEDVANMIHSIGLYKNKSKNIIGLARALVERKKSLTPEERQAYENSPDNRDCVPDTMRELMKLPGVGRKTANVVLAEGFGEQRIAVDTHVFRVSNRIGLAHSDNVTDTEKQLQEILPNDRWTEAHHLLIWHGRKCCSARKPACDRCPVSEMCSSRDKFSS